MHTVCIIVSVTGISVTVNGFDLFPLMVISVTVNVNFNHTGRQFTSSMDQLQ